MAHIDSAGLLIQIPMNEFDLLAQHMKEVDPTIRSEVHEEGYRLVSARNCDDVVKLYGDLEF